MSLIRIIIADQNEYFSAEPHGSDGDRIIASLTAEPETLEELLAAYKRFSRSETDLEIWSERVSISKNLNPASTFDFMPFDAGLIIVDLFSKTILVKSTYSNAAPEGHVPVRDRLADKEEQYFPLPYVLSTDWKVLHDKDSFIQMFEDRRSKRIANERIDYRAVLYGTEMVEFFVESISDKELPLSEKTIENIHAKWLLEPRNSLQGKNPRDVLLEKQKFIDMDLQSRSIQHSFTRDIPPAIDRESQAYKFAGFGTHEIVVYYDAIRAMMSAIEHRFLGMKEIVTGDETAYFKNWFDKWRYEPNIEYGERKPVEIIDSERRRMNLVMNPSESIIDEDCPICQAIAEDFDNPGFWHLDAAHFDEHFAFSFFETEEDWVSDQEYWRVFEERQLKRDILATGKKSYEITDPDEFIRIMRGDLP